MHARWWFVNSSWFSWIQSYFGFLTLVVKGCVRRSFILKGSKTLGCNKKGERAEYISYIINIPIDVGKFLSFLFNIPHSRSGIAAKNRPNQRHSTDCFCEVYCLICLKSLARVWAGKRAGGHHYWVGENRTFKNTRVRTLHDFTKPTQRQQLPAPLLWSPFGTILSAWLTQK